MYDHKLTSFMGIDIPSLEPGQSTRIVCPACGGGSTRERSLAITRNHFEVYWHCFRANCTNRGKQSTFDYRDDAPEEPIEKTPRPYTDALYPLSKLERGYFNFKYNLPDPDMYRSHEHRPHEFRYVLPIKRHDGTVRGHVARVPWGESGTPKSLTYWNSTGPLLAWYHPRYRCTNRDVLVVEDQLSAMRAAEHLNLVACAILGTGLNAEKVQELQKHTHYLTIALDADATGQAFAMARKWGQAFANCKVLVLSQDIKDMPLKDLTNLNI